MIDHIGLDVSDLARSRAFYAGALAPLGYGLVAEGPGRSAFGPPGMPLFWIYAKSPAHTGVHIALVARNRAAVDAFHAAAVNCGGRDHGPPGLRPAYHPHYYGAFVLDPDGNNIEAVCHRPLI